MDLEEDIESDLHRYHGATVDFSRDEYDGIPAERLIAWIERLPAYEGALASRMYHLQQEAKRHNPSRAALEKPGTVQVDSVAALTADPAASDLIEYVKV